jgi:hypothetical protein
VHQNGDDSHRPTPPRLSATATKCSHNCRRGRGVRSASWCPLHCTVPNYSSASLGLGGDSGHSVKLYNRQLLTGAEGSCRRRIPGGTSTALIPGYDAGGIVTSCGVQQPRHGISKDSVPRTPPEILARTANWPVSSCSSTASVPACNSFDHWSNGIRGGNSLQPRSTVPSSSSRPSLLQPSSRYPMPP